MTLQIAHNEDGSSVLEKPVQSVPRVEWGEVPARPEVFPLTVDLILIGRGSDAHIMLGHPLVSRQHAQIVREGESWVLVDLQSTHGTYVNGDRIERRPLRPGDRIRLGLEGVELFF